MKKASNIVAVILFIMGVVWLCISAFFVSDNAAFMKQAVETDGVITDISHDRLTPKGSRKHDVQIFFTVDGQNYSGILNEYHSGMRIGDEITVYYDSANPNRFRSGSTVILSYIFIGIGIVLTVAGIFTFCIGRRQQTRFRKLKESGRRITAQIDDVYINHSIHVNNRHPSVVKCSYLDRSTNQLYTFKSHNVWFDVKVVVDAFHISAISVYLDENNPKKYYVDVEDIKKYTGN